MSRQSKTRWNKPKANEIPEVADIEEVEEDVEVEEIEKTDIKISEEEVEKEVKVEESKSDKKTVQVKFMKESKPLHMHKGKEYKKGDIIEFSSVKEFNRIFGTFAKEWKQVG